MTKEEKESRAKQIDYEIGSKYNEINELYKEKRHLLMPTDEEAKKFFVSALIAVGVCGHEDDLTFADPKIHQTQEYCTMNKVYLPHKGPFNISVNTKTKAVHLSPV